jgi:L-ascorbate metabolism protein UlaG (beta-lactamase superfamily)
VAGGECRLTYIGHATVLVELNGIRLLTDPFLSSGILHVRRRVPVPHGEDLGPLDAILISHSHRDHLDRHSLRRLAGLCPVVVPHGVARFVGHGSRVDVIELCEGERLQLGQIAVEAVHAAHDGRRNPFGRATASVGYLIDGPPPVYFAGDTDLFSGMSALAGRVDVALLPVWGWGPRVGAGHLDPVRAAEAVRRIRPRVAVPIHWGTLRAIGVRAGDDPIAPARAFAEAVARVAADTEVRVLMPGQHSRLSLPGGGTYASCTPR